MDYKPDKGLVRGGGAAFLAATLMWVVDTFTSTTMPIDAAMGIVIITFAVTEYLVDKFTNE